MVTYCSTEKVKNNDGTKRNNIYEKERRRSIETYETPIPRCKRNSKNKEAIMYCYESHMTTDACI